MSEPIEAFMVTEGEYSDYGVCAVFALEADAERAKEAGLGDDVSPVALYPAGLVPRKTIVWAAECRTGGSEIRTFSREAWPHDRGGSPSGRPLVEEYYWGVVAHAPTEEAARKACADRAAKIRAEALEPGATS